MELSINVFVLAGIFATGVVLGFFLRRRNIAAYDKKVAELEKEMLTSHAEILQLQREKIEILRKLESPAIPVIPIKASSKEEKAVEALPDVASRKKLLGKHP
jgi:septation ring formation regulator EzrA